MAIRIVRWTEKVNKNASLQVETCLSASRITFYFFNPFHHSSQTIQLEYVWIYPVVAELTRVIYGRNQQDESKLSHLGLLTRVDQSPESMTIDSG